MSRHPHCLLHCGGNWRAHLITGTMCVASQFFHGLNKSVHDDWDSHSVSICMLFPSCCSMETYSSGHALHHGLSVCNQLSYCSQSVTIEIINGEKGVWKGKFASILLDEWVIQLNVPVLTRKQCMELINFAKRMKLKLQWQFITHTRVKKLSCTLSKLKFISELVFQCEQGEVQK